MPRLEEFAEKVERDTNREVMNCSHNHFGTVSLVREAEINKGDIQDEKMQNNCYENVEI